MYDLMRRVALVVVPVVAITIILVGLLSADSGPQTPEARAEAIAANVRCPFCEGESIAESTSAVAADYEALIREWVDEGLGDEQIYDRFRSRFGDGIVLDGGFSGWSRALWLIPVAALVALVFAVRALRREAVDDRVEEPVP